MPIINDFSMLPLILQRFRRPVGRAEIEANNQTLLDHMNHGERILTIAIVDELGNVDRSLISLQAAWFREHHALLAERWLGMAFVFGSPALRFVLSGMLVLTRLPMPYTVAESPEAALRWAAEILRKHKLPVPASPRFPE